MTLRMAQFDDNIPIYDYDYDVNKILFSCIKTTDVIPVSDHFGGGAPKGALVKPNNVKEINAMQHCATEDMDFLANSNWVIPKVSDSFGDSFTESLSGPGVAVSSSVRRQPQIDKNAPISANGGNTTSTPFIISPAKLGLKYPHSTQSKRLHHKTKDNRKTDYRPEEFFAISRPLSALKNKSKLSPRHLVFVDKRK